MSVVVHAELRRAAAEGRIPAGWASGRAATAAEEAPPCRDGGDHEWEKAADDTTDARHGITHVDACTRCKMRMISIEDGAGGATAYAPHIEYVIWHVSNRAHEYAHGRTGAEGVRR